ncbi:MAG: hypothetical protein RLZ28_81 [Actinomycetota bacterium]
MEDLRLLAIEHDFVLLESSSGEKFRVALDENLRRAARQDRPLTAIESSVSPREVQDLVRSGQSIDDVVAKTGAPLSYVEKFAAPVLDEISHILKSALAVRLSLSNDRFGEPTQIEFGALIREKLDSLGASDAAWTARKVEGGSWQIRCDFQLQSNGSLAIWSFDLRRSGLSPENEVALNLAASQEAAPPLLSSTSSALPFSVQPSQPSAPKNAPVERLVSKNLTSSLGETQEFAEIIPFGRSRNSTAQVPVIAAGTSAEVDDVDVASIDDFEDDNGDLLDSLRRRRDSREQNTGFTPIVSVFDPTDEASDQTAAIDLEFDETTVWIESSDEIIIEDSEHHENEPQVSEPVRSESQTPDEAPASGKRGRAAMPSWDEIVFGTKPDSKDEAD